VYYNCLKFHKNSISSLVGVALTRYMDGRTGRFLYIPPNFVCGGYNNKIATKTVVIIQSYLDGSQNSNNKHNIYNVSCFLQNYDCP
jgi:uncharacterized RmlC-like cupin family protein